MVTGCYSLHLYCRYSAVSIGRKGTCPNDNCYPQFMGDYIGRNFSECKREAQRDGWVFNRDRDVTCKACAKGA